jgi:hypothetical protein
MKNAESGNRQNKHTSDGYRTVRIQEALYLEVEHLTQGKEALYRSVSEFVHEAIRLRLSQVKRFCLIKVHGGSRPVSCLLLEESKIRTPSRFEKACVGQDSLTPLSVISLPPTGGNPLKE